MKYVVSLGGSLINPEKVDSTFLKKFKALIGQRAKKKERFYIVAGGGNTARQYQRAAKKLVAAKDEDLDRLGIAATKLNAELIRVLFAEQAGKQVKVFSGTRPGWSTDYVAVKIAQKNNIQTVINLSNVDYVYSTDPKKNKKSQPIKKMAWQEYIDKFGKKWDPGANLPFDPVGASLAYRSGITVVIMNGGKLKNFEHFLDNQSFQGTTIH